MATLVAKTSMIVGGIATVSGLGSAIYFSTLLTIEQKILKDGLQLISDNEDYKFILFTNRDNAELKTAISKDSLNFETQGSEIKKWCEKVIKKWATNSNLLKNAKEWCTVPKIKTLKDRLKGTLHNSGAWQGTFTKLASEPVDNNKLLAALNALKPNPNLNKASNNGGAKLNEWCTLALQQKIYEIDKEHKTEENINAWCFHKG